MTVPAAVGAASFAGAFAKGRGFLLNEVHFPLAFGGATRVGGDANGFDQVLELCSDQPIIVFAICDSLRENVIRNKKCL